MYRWYQRSDICYAFLSDLPAASSLKTSLKECRWFKRGWTLQELIAPENLYFFDQDWNNRGSKKDLVEILSDITGINTSILLHAQQLSSVAVAQRLSWAADRKTTRIEDTAYCLLGIFDVNMPLLYGEEEKSFRRLQEEIIRSTADFSIFAWRMLSVAGNKKGPNDRVFCGILAEAPIAFASCGSFVKKMDYERQEFSISNIGVKTQAQILCEPIVGKHASRYIFPVACSWAPRRSLGVRLRMCGPDQFIRDDPWTLAEYTENLFRYAPKARYLLTELPEIYPRPGSQISDMSLFIAQTRSHVLQIRLPTEMRIYDAWPGSRFDDEDRLFFVSGNTRWDSATLRLNIHCTAQVDRRETTVELECMFYGKGWSMLEPSSLHCTLVDYRPFTTRLNEVQSKISAWNYDRYHVLDALIYYKIPKCSSVAFKIQGTKTSALVSFMPSLVSDPSICRNKFWRIEFSCDLYETDNLPQAAGLAGKWVL